MKQRIHPEYNEKVEVTCSCGHTLTTGSTESALSVEVCSNCHPFYTGKQKLVDVAGRVDKFRQRQEETEGIKAKAEEVKAKRAKKAKNVKEVTNKDKEDILQLN